MSAELLEIQPQELKFIFELKKQCSCSVRLVNKSNNHVAFKVKTTSPKKYCVRPNIGIIKPKSTCDFTVTMQAQKVPPPDMICKDKFLVQGTIVPAKTTDEDIDSSMFAKDDGRYVEEKKMRVILVSPPSSPVLSPINGTWKQVPSYEASVLKDEVLGKVESFPPHQTGTEDVEDSKMENGEIKPEKDIEYKMMKKVEEPAKEVGYKTMKEGEELAYDVEYKTMKKVEEPTNEVEYATKEKLEEPMMKIVEPAKDVEYKRTEDGVDVEEDQRMKNKVDRAKDEGNKVMEDVEKPAYDKEYKGMKDVDELKLVKDISEMKSKLNEVESKLRKAEATIAKLTGDRRGTAQERESLQQELELLRSQRVVRKVRVGFPFLFVCTVALIGVFLGYRLRG